jgi:hypothetical protein
MVEFVSWTCAQHVRGTQFVYIQNGSTFVRRPALRIRPPASSIMGRNLPKLELCTWQSAHHNIKVLSVDLV